MDFLLKSGPFGWLIIVSFSLLLVTGIFVVSITRSRRAIFTFALLAFLPLVLGLLGTFIGNIQVSIETQRSPSDPEYARSMRAEARRESWNPTYLGLGASAALLLAVGCGIALTKKVDQAGDGGTEQAV